MGEDLEAEAAIVTARSAGRGLATAATAAAAATTAAAAATERAPFPASHRVASLTCLVDAAAEPPLADGVAEASSSGDSWRPTLQQCEAAPSAPVLLTAVPGCSGQRILSQHDPHCLPVNTGQPIELETPLFSGRACVWVKGLPGAPEAVFEGRRRQSLVTLQGRFRRPVPLDDLVTGQEFGSVANLPPAWLVEGILLKVARACSPAMAIGPLSQPSMLMPVIAGCNEIHAARPGEEPDLAAPPCEDLRLFDPVCLTAPDGSPLPAGRRKARFARAAARAGRCWPTDLVFTLHFYQHFVDVSRYSLDVLHLRFDLTRYLREPLQLMMRCRRSGEFAYRLHLWHARLLRER